MSISEEARKAVLENAKRASKLNSVGISEISKEGRERLAMEIQAAQDRISHEVISTAFMAGYMARFEEESEGDAANVY